MITRLNEASAELIEGLTRYLCRLSEGRFYGVVEIQYQNGEIILVRKQESFKPAVFLVVE